MTWKIKEELPFERQEGIRGIYIRCLERMIENLKKEKDIGEWGGLEGKPVPEYDFELPAIIFVLADSGNEREGREGKLEFLCYADRQDFLRDLEKMEKVRVRIFPRHE